MRFPERIPEGHVGIGHGPRLRQPSTGIGLAKQQPCRSGSTVLSRQVHIKDGADGIRKGQFHRRSAEEHHPLPGFDQSLQKRQLILRQTHILPVAALAFHIVGQTGKHEDFFILGRFLHRFGHQRSVRLGFVLLIATAEGIGNAHLVKSVPGRGQSGGRNHGAARPLIAHPVKQASDDQNLFRLVQGKQTVIFQQHGAICGDFRCKGVVLVPISRSHFRNSSSFHQPKHIPGSLV